MELFGKTICVTFNELVDSGILSEANYKKHVRQGKFRVLQKGGNGRKALVAYDSLTDAIRAAYDAQYPDSKNYLQKQLSPMDERLKSDSKAVDFYKKHTPKIDAERQAEYVLNAKVLNAMVAQEMTMTALHGKNGFIHKRLVRDTIVALCEKMRARYRHTLPKSEPRLLEKYNDYRRCGYEALVNKNGGNQSARKIGPREGRLLLKLKRSKFPVYTDMQIFEEYNRQAELKGWKTIESPQTVINYLYKTAVMPPFMARSPLKTSSCPNSIPDFPTCRTRCGTVTVRS